MKHFIQFVVWALFFSTLASCTGQKSHNDNKGDLTESSDKLYDEVMAIHDEAMEKMGRIHNLKKDLNEVVKNTPELVQSRKDQIESLILKLDSAGKGMMDWMHEFNPAGMDTLSDAATLEYLNIQLEEVKKVRNNIFQSIKAAEAEKAAQGAN